MRLGPIRKVPKIENLKVEYLDPSGFCMGEDHSIQDKQGSTSWNISIT